LVCSDRSDVLKSKAAFARPTAANRPPSIVALMPIMQQPTTENHRFLETEMRKIDAYSGLAGFGCRSDYGEFDRRTEMAKRSLVPETGGLRVVAIRGAGGGLVIEVEPREPAQCPRCGSISTSRHSAYIRTLRDLPIQGDAVTLRVHAGRWRCRSSSCVRRTFVAPLTALACARQRRTRRLDEVAFLIGHAMGGGTARAPARRASEPGRHTDKFEACSAVERTERTNARDWHR
jgi:hypothetical protein